MRPWNTVNRSTSKQPNGKGKHLPHTHMREFNPAKVEK